MLFCCKPPEMFCRLSIGMGLSRWRHFWVNYFLKNNIISVLAKNKSCIDNEEKRQNPYLVLSWSTKLCNNKNNYWLSQLPQQKPQNEWLSVNTSVHLFCDCALVLEVKRQIQLKGNSKAATTMLMSHFQQSIAGQDDNLDIYTAKQRWKYNFPIICLCNT